MKVLALTTIYPPHVGGAPSLIERWVTSLDATGHDVDVVTFGADGTNPEMNERQVAYDDRSTLTIHRLASDDMNSRSILRLFALALKTSAQAWMGGRRYDAVFSAVAYPCAPMARGISLIFRCPYVVYAHGEDVSVVERGSPRLAAMKSQLLRSSLRRARKVFANSHATIDRLNAIGYVSAVEVLPPSFDPAPFTDAPTADVNALRTSLHLEKRRILLTIARLTSPRKGHDVVIRALALLIDEFPDLHYAIIGTGDQTTLRKLAQDHGVADHVTIIDFVADDEVPLYMNAADLYVMPSRWDPIVREGEGFGIVYLEAAAAGKPSIAARTGGSSEAVIDRVTGLTVDPESPAEVSEAIRLLLTDSELARRLGEQGRERAIAEYSSARVLPRLAAAVAGVASR
ncbi:MAG: glycosyltransferase family 4 protein [Ilumatobacteraceae bacterium]